jgi:hypothetical protein
MIPIFTQNGIFQGYFFLKNTNNPLKNNVLFADERA